MKNPETVSRIHDRLIFGEGPHRWSVGDPASDALSERRRRMTAEKDYLPRTVLGDYLYLVLDCPTTKLAQQKLAAIRRAVRCGP